MEQSLTLYDLEGELTALLDTEAMTEGDEEAHLQILDDIAKAGEAAVAKRDRTIGFLRHLDLQQANIKTEIARLKALGESYAKGQARVEQYVIGLIEKFVAQPKKGAKRLEGTIGVMSLRKGPDTAVVDDPAVIPLAYKDVTVKLSGIDMGAIMGCLLHFGREDLANAMNADCTDKPRLMEIRQALKAGGEIEGADLRFGQNSLVVK